MDSYEVLNLCPLLKMDIYLSDCMEVQEVREDNMDKEFFFTEFDIDEANEKCEKCRWYVWPHNFKKI